VRHTAARGRIAHTNRAVRNALFTVLVLIVAKALGATSSPGVHADLVHGLEPHRASRVRTLGVTFIIFLMFGAAIAWSGQSVLQGYSAPRPPLTSGIVIMIGGPTADAANTAQSHVMANMSWDLDARKTSGAFADLQIHIAQIPPWSSILIGMPGDLLSTYAAPDISGGPSTSTVPEYESWRGEAPFDSWRWWSIPAGYSPGGEVRFDASMSGKNAFQRTGAYLAVRSPSFIEPLSDLAPVSPQSDRCPFRPMTGTCYYSGELSLPGSLPSDLPAYRELMSIESANGSQEDFVRLAPVKGSVTVQVNQRYELDRATEAGGSFETTSFSSVVWQGVVSSSEAIFSDQGELRDAQRRLFVGGVAGGFAASLAAAALWSALVAGNRRRLNAHR
jgi:hypothetical protein